MHIYISQRNLEAGVNAIVEEMVPFLYMMLREGYDAESIIQFLESAEDEDFDFIYEQADSEMLSESVVDEMSDEEVLLYEEQIGLIVENVLGKMLTRMSPAALKQFVKNNAAARRLAERLGLLKKAPTPKTGTPKPTATPKTQAPKPKSSRTTDQKTQTASQPPKLQPPKSKTPPKTQPGGILKSTPAKVAGTGLALAGAGLIGQGLLGDKLSGDGTDGSTTTADAGTNTNSTPPKPEEPKPPKPQSSGTPWWIARNRDLIGRQPTFRSDVAMRRFRNPSARANFTNIMSEYEYLVDYLIAEGHADTVEEATYVLQQMGEEAAVEILNEIV